MTTKKPGQAARAVEFSPDEEARIEREAEIQAEIRRRADAKAPGAMPGAASVISTAPAGSAAEYQHQLKEYQRVHGLPFPPMAGELEAKGRRILILSVSVLDGKGARFVEPWRAQDDGDDWRVVEPLPVSGRHRDWQKLTAPMPSQSRDDVLQNLEADVLNGRGLTAKNLASLAPSNRADALHACQPHFDLAWYDQERLPVLRRLGGKKLSELRREIDLKFEIVSEETV